MPIFCALFFVYADGPILFTLVYRIFLRRFKRKTSLFRRYVLRKREINLRTLYPVPLRGLRDVKHTWDPTVNQRDIPRLKWWRQVCYHCRSFSNTIDDVRSWVCQNESLKKTLRSLFQHLFSRVMASYETIKMHPSCNTIYSRGGG